MKNINHQKKYRKKKNKNARKIDKKRRTNSKNKEYKLLKEELKTVKEEKENPKFLFSKKKRTEIKEKHNLVIITPSNELNFLKDFIK